MKKTLIIMITLVLLFSVTSFAPIPENEILFIIVSVLAVVSIVGSLIAMMVFAYLLDKNSINPKYDEDYEDK